ncbi:hypothetical protein SAMN05421783_107118 [Thiocapsa roseopersicina]|uniref:Uncharacterized protein n=1 Tax=Thiocapsa roseopersicina TaxID=1058 RepID=A0A1H2VQ01_THIRO|nr:hypothetical protein SAMN05421783_107118 [Thiocapsa roseopersicina]
MHPKGCVAFCLSELFFRVYRVLACGGDYNMRSLLIANESNRLFR